MWQLNLRYITIKFNAQSRIVWNGFPILSKMTKIWGLLLLFVGQKFAGIARGVFLRNLINCVKLNCSVFILDWSDRLFPVNAEWYTADTEWTGSSIQRTLSERWVVQMLNWLGTCFLLREVTLGLGRVKAEWLKYRIPRGVIEEKN